MKFSTLPSNVAVALSRAILEETGQNSAVVAVGFDGQFSISEQLQTCSGQGELRLYR
jgi:hypothetical protein